MKTLSLGPNDKTRPSCRDSLSLSNINEATEASGTIGSVRGHEVDLAEIFTSRVLCKDGNGETRNEPLSILWRNLTVCAPSGSAGDMLVKTMPQAILNTVSRDPINILAYLIPRFGKWMENRATGSNAVNLVQNLDGVLKANEMLLVLGIPGSGCSTTMRALTACSHKNVLESGEIRFDGKSRKEVQEHFRGDFVFVDDDDQHFPALTVAQTLEFAQKTKVPTSTQSVAKLEFMEHITQTLLKSFGMSIVRDTIVGDALNRGVSGGQRKRVTLSEAILCDANMMAWDNITRGLDASTAFECLRCIRFLTKELQHRTTVVSLYQVSESIFNLFDRVSVMDKGRCIYYGPRDQVRTYFYNLGYEPLPRETTADFITNVTNPDLAKYRSGFVGYIPRTAKEREAVWRQSDLYERLMAEIKACEKDCDISARNSTTVMKSSNLPSPYTVSFWNQIGACIKRQLLIRWGSWVELQIKLFTIVSVTFILGAVFFRQPYDSGGIFTRGSALLHLCMFNGWLQMSEGFEAVAGRPVIQRHKRFAFARPSATVFARFIVDVPFLLVQCFLTLVIFWGLSGLRRSAGAFFIYLLYMFLAAYNLTALYRAIAAFSATFNQFIRFAVMAFSVSVVFMGYVLHRPQMNRMKFLSYIQALSYAFEGVLTNEIAYNIPCKQSSIVPFGKLRDAMYQTCALKGSQPGSIIISASDYLRITFGFESYRKSYNWLVVSCLTIIYMLITIFASEFIDWQAGGGNVVIFARTTEAKRLVQRRVSELKPATDLNKSSGELEAGKHGNALHQDSLICRNDSMCFRRQANGDVVSHSQRCKAQEPSSASKSVEKGKRDSKARPIFTWRDINLTSRSTKLLEAVDGWVKPGELTALMGESGAGKTTLLSALSDRGVYGTVTGERLLDGSALNHGFQRGTGFVSQDDIHLATQTVREAFEFSARLRQPAEVSDADKIDTVERLIHMLGLCRIQDALIGSAGSGLNRECRKRVMIGIELAARPDFLIFLDEPTSGLDSAGAASIIQLLRRLVKEDQQAILCTIHQPSALLFESFDNILLLQPGGKTAYFGQIGEERGIGAKKICDYFERNGAPHCPPSQNAGEYILKLVNSSNDERGTNWADVWHNSSEYKEVRDEIDRIKSERKGIRGPPDKSGTFAANPATQIYEVTRRQSIDLWRDTDFWYGMMSSNLVIGSLLGGAFARLGTSPTDLQSRVFVTFFILIASPAKIIAVISKFYSMRMLFEKREGPSNVYGWWALLTAFTLAMVFVALSSSIVFFLPAYFLPFYSTPSWEAGFFFLNMFTVEVWFFLLGFLLMASTSTSTAAANLMPFVLPIVIFVNGGFVPPGTLPEPFHSFVYYLNPISFYVRSQAATVLHDQTVTCTSEDMHWFNAPPSQSCEQYAGWWVDSVGGYLTNPTATSLCGFCQYRTGDQFALSIQADYSFRWQNYGILLGFTIFEMLLAYAVYWCFTVKCGKFRNIWRRRTWFKSRKKDYTSDVDVSKPNLPGNLGYLESSSSPQSDELVSHNSDHQ